MNDEPKTTGYARANLKERGKSMSKDAREAAMDAKSVYAKHNAGYAKAIDDYVNSNSLGNKTIDAAIEHQAIWYEGFHAGHAAATAEAEGRIGELVKALGIAANQLEGVSLAVAQHGQNMSVPFFIEYYNECATKARATLERTDIGGGDVK